MEEHEVWLWEYTDEFGKRRVSRWRMSADQAALYKDAVPVPGSREIRTPIGSMSDFTRSLSTYGRAATTNPPGSSSASDTSKD